MKRSILLSTVVAMGGLVSAPIFAQEAENFLDGPLTMVVPYGPGGNTDLRARAFQEFMPEVIGQPVVLEHISGGGGLVGATAGFARPADGTTVVISGTSDGPHAHAALELTEIPWAWEDWTPIGMFALAAQGFVVGADSEHESLGDLVEQVKAEPGSVTLASIGPGRVDDLQMIEFMQATDTVGDWNWVFYESSGEIQADIISGDIDVGFIAVTREDMIDHPDFDVLAIGMGNAEKPEENFPFTWPTVEDYVGEPLSVLTAGYAVLYANADVPEERKDYLEQAFEATTEIEGFQEVRMTAGEPAIWIGSDQTQEFLDAMVNQIRELRPLRDEVVGQ